MTQNRAQPYQDFFQILMSMNLAVMETSDPRGILKVLLDAALRLFQVQSCSLALWDEEKGGLSFTVHGGQARLSNFFVPAGRGFAGWVMETGTPVHCNNPSEDERFYGNIDRRTGMETKTLMCAPMHFHQRVMGVITVLNTRKKRGFNDQDLRLLCSFGDLAGVAINNNATLVEADHAGSIYRADAEHRYALVWGKSQAMKAVVATARQVAGSATTVLLLSESGTGKEVMAHAIHRWSRRAQAPFVAVNCVALTQELLGSELFGHEKGAFTGATGRKIGKFELAHGGTIFLDEIGELTPDLQAKLLRVLQEREFQRVGGAQDIRTNVRIIAATNRHLKRAVKKGSFRPDLYYRLNVVKLRLPPLRDRREDIADLVQFFLKQCSAEAGRTMPEITPAAMDLLLNYHWPGNVRQLRNTIERAVVLTSGRSITPQSIAAGQPFDSFSIGDPPLQESRWVAPIDTSLPLAEAVAVFKRQRIRQALASSSGNQAKAAELLGIQPSNLSRWLKKNRQEIPR